jgi:hypothetical protein
MTGVVGAALFPGDREGLAGESGSDEIHFATPREAIEGSQISPDRRVIQGTVFNTRRQDFAGSGFVFHEADNVSPWQSQPDSEVKSSRS